MASVRVDSGQFPLMRNVDVSRQPERSKVYNAWTKAFNSNVPDAVGHLADIIEDVYAYELWRDNYLETPEQFFEQIGILGLDLEDPAKLINALRSGDQKKIEQVKRKLVIKERASSATQRELAEAAKCSQGRVSQLLTTVNNQSERKARNAANTTARQLYLPQDASAAAEKIRAKFGAEFAMQLKEAL